MLYTSAAIIYLGVMLYIILSMLKEVRPALYYILAGIVFVFSQLAWFLLGKVICNGSGSKLDGSFLATIFETITVVILFLGWKSITEGGPMFLTPVFCCRTYKVAS